MEAWRHLPATKEAFRRLESKINEIIEGIRMRKAVNPQNADETQYNMGVLLGKMDGLQEALNIGKE